MNDERIYMLNALWFKKDGGAEKYNEYVEAVRPLVADVGVRIYKSYVPDMDLIGEWDPDLFFVAEWPSWAAFQALTSSEAYLKVRPLREDALDKSLLIRCRRGPIG